MSGESIWVRLGGTTPATEIAPHTPPTWETLADGGNGEASFELGKSAKSSPHLTAPGTLMEVLTGCYRLWTGRVADYDRHTGQVVGRGIHTDALHVPALTPGGDSTRSTVTALATANAAPWKLGIANTIGYGGTAAGNDDSPLMMAELFDLVAQEQGARWGQNPDRSLYMLPDPTSPTWTVIPDAAAFGTTNEDQATALVGRYFNGTTNVTTVRPAAVPTSARAEIRDLTGRGALTEAQANAILDAELGTKKSLTGWVNGVTLHREQVTRNGTPANLSGIHARSRMVRAHGVPVMFGALQSTTLDVVLGKTRYTAGQDTIYLEPVGTAPRTFVDVVAAS